MTSTDNAHLRVESFSKTYRETAAVSDLSFAVHGGEILGLVGPNGAGKTTTMRAITGIIPPTRGALSIAGYEIQASPIEAKRGLAYVPDDPRLFESLTVWEHLLFTAKAYRVTDFESRAERLLDDFELTPMRDKLAQELSRGMRQKVAISCAYLYQPAVILFDEPLTGLDPRGIRTLKRSIIERANEGAALVVSSHLLSLVEDLCTHLLLIHHGRSLFFGPIQELRTAFGQAGQDSTLEDLFFQITEGEEAGVPSVPGPDTEAEQTASQESPPT